MDMDELEILLVEDNPTDAELTMRALKRKNLANKLVWVKDGEEAIDFAKQLKKQGMKYWQVLPFSYPGMGNSPYQSFSAFAGNPYLIDFEELFSLNFLDKSDVDNAFLSDNDTFINYGLIYENKLPLLRKAYNNYKNLLPDAIKYDFESFKIANLFRDINILKVAQNDAKLILEENRLLNNANYGLLRNKVDKLIDSIDNEIILN